MNTAIEKVQRSSIKQSKSKSLKQQAADLSNKIYDVQILRIELFHTDGSVGEMNLTSQDTSISYISISEQFVHMRQYLVKCHKQLGIVMFRAHYEVLVDGCITPGHSWWPVDCLTDENVDPDTL